MTAGCWKARRRFYGALKTAPCWALSISSLRSASGMVHSLCQGQPQRSAMPTTLPISRISTVTTPAEYSALDELAHEEGLRFQTFIVHRVARHYSDRGVPVGTTVASRVRKNKVCRSFRTPGSPFAKSTVILSRRLKRSSRDLRSPDSGV